MNSEDQFWLGFWMLVSGVLLACIIAIASHTSDIEACGKSCKGVPAKFVDRGQTTPMTCECWPP